MEDVDGDYQELVYFPIQSDEPNHLQLLLIPELLSL